MLSITEPLIVLEILIKNNDFNVIGDFELHFYSSNSLRETAIIGNLDGCYGVS
jgi:hypothetical protein